MGESVGESLEEADILEEDEEFPSFEQVGRHSCSLAVDSVIPLQKEC